MFLNYEKMATLQSTVGDMGVRRPSAGFQNQLVVSYRVTPFHLTITRQFICMQANALKMHDLLFWA